MIEVVQGKSEKQTRPQCAAELQQNNPQSAAPSPKHRFPNSSHVCKTFHKEKLESLEHWACKWF